MGLAILPCTWVPAPVQGTPLQIAGIVAVPGPPGSPPTFESLVRRPAGVVTATVGFSADTERAPPNGVAMVYRICGIRWPPVDPIAPPNSIDSVSASASAKFEIAWPPRNPPNVP